MAKQDKHKTLTDGQKEILNLEKKYFEKLEEIITSKKTSPTAKNEFQDDLLAIEHEIQLSYATLANTWHVKNKIKVAAERLIRHHIYTKLSSEIIGIYESPISSDLGLIFEDCILCVDCKTLDTKSNSVDIRYTSVEPNQISFDNSGHNYIKGISNLSTRTRTTRLPILTYVIKIIYHDDNVRFNLSKTYSIGEKPTLILACIPNGELSNLFDKDIIFNFKTYKYHTPEEGNQFTPVSIPKTVKKKVKWTDKYCKSQNFIPFNIPQTRGTKEVYFDPANNCYWTYTQEEKIPKIRAISRGDTMRLNNDFLEDRFDSNNNPWTGYKEYDI